MKNFVLVFAVCLLTSCATKMFSQDPYARGLRFYERGELELAEQMWKPLAANGDCDAQFRLGLLYVDKPATSKELSDQYRNEFLRLFRAAAAQGQPKALAITAELYWKSAEATFQCPSCDIKKNLAKAYAYYTLAEKFAVYDYDKKAFGETKEKISGELSPNEKKSADLEISNWKGVPSQCKPRYLF